MFHVLEYFNNKTNGVFFEAGAWDGEDMSNTLYLEVKSVFKTLLQHSFVDKAQLDWLAGRSKLYCLQKTFIKEEKV